MRDQSDMGEMERKVTADLAVLPQALRDGGIAGEALLLARVLDEGVCIPDSDGAHLSGFPVRAEAIAGLGREIRMCLLALNDMHAGEVPGDTTDEVNSRRESRALRSVRSLP